MSLENDMTAKVLGKILAEGMNLADCELENKIESEALDKLKKIQTVISSDKEDSKKLQQVKGILTDQLISGTQITTKY